MALLVLMSASRAAKGVTATVFIEYVGLVTDLIRKPVSSIKARVISIDGGIQKVHHKLLDRQTKKFNYLESTADIAPGDVLWTRVSKSVARSLKVGQTVKLSDIHAMVYVYGPRHEKAGSLAVDHDGKLKMDWIGGSIVHSNDSCMDQPDDPPPTYDSLFSQ